MAINKRTIKDPDMAKVEGALKRAAQNARKIAKETGTPLVIYKNGKIIKQSVDDEKSQVQ